MQDQTPPSIRRDRMAESKAKLSAEYVEVKRKIGEAKGRVFIGLPKIPDWEWCALLDREAAIKAEIARIEIGLASANREMSEHRWRVENEARNLLLSIVHHAAALCDDDTDANWRRLESALDMLRDKCPGYVELHGSAVGPR